MSYEGSLMPVDELLREVAVRLAAWSEPLPKVTKHSHMAMQCSFFDTHSDIQSNTIVSIYQLILHALLHGRSLAACRSRSLASCLAVFVRTPSS